MPREVVHEKDRESTIMTAAGEMQRRKDGQRSATTTKQPTVPKSMSPTTKSSRKSISPNRSSSAARVRRSVSSGVHVDNNAELSLKVDFLMKKTKTLENSLHKLKTGNDSEGRNSHQWATHLSELIKMDKHSIADIRDEVNGLNQRIQRLVQMETQDRAAEKTSHHCRIDTGTITEQVFNRVHRQFTQVVDEVVRSCVLEQMDSFSSTSARQLEQAESHRSMAAQISELKRKQQLIDDSFNAHGDLSKRVRESSCALQTVIQKMDTDNRALVDGITKRLNEGMASSREGMSEKIAESMAEARHELRSEVNVCLKNGTQQLQDSICGLEMQFAQLSQHMGTLEESLKPVRDLAFRAESNASYAVSLCTDNKRVCSRTDDMLQRLGRDMETLSQRVHQLQQLTGEGEYVLGEAPPSLRPHKGRINRRPYSAASEGEPDSNSMQESMHDVQGQLVLQDQKIASLTKMLADHCRDYQEVVASVSSAGKQTKASQKELHDTILGFADMQQSVQKVLNDVVMSNEEDRKALAAMKTDTTSTMADIDALRSSILELTEVVPTLRDVSETVRDHLATYHENEVLPLNEKVVELEEQLLTASNPDNRAGGNSYPSNDCEGVSEDALRYRWNDAVTSRHGAYPVGFNLSTQAEMVGAFGAGVNRGADTLPVHSCDAPVSLEVARKSEPPVNRIGRASHEAVVLDFLPQSSLPMLRKTQVDTSPGRAKCSPGKSTARVNDIGPASITGSSHDLGPSADTVAHRALSNKSGSCVLHREDIPGHSHTHEIRDPEVEESREKPPGLAVTSSEDSAGKSNTSCSDEKVKLLQKKIKHRQKFQNRVNMT